MAANAVIPTLLLLSLTMGTLTQLEQLSQQSADKAVKYSTDMTNAIDCAYRAEALDKCSPDLFSTDFKAESARTQAILEDLKKQQMGSHLKTEDDLPKKDVKKDEKKRA